ncbi:hypothetical protein JL720_7876 [Aureococcus anophagefferens]|nr:hypothetical protein JL720_7876 [Aureococcus anophagefferens]
MKSFLPMPDPIEREIDESPNDITSFPDRRIHWNPDDDADDDRSSIFEFRDNEDDEQIRSERSLRGNWSVEDDAWEDDAAEEATFPVSKPDMDESAPAPPPLLRKDDVATDRLALLACVAAADYAVGLAGGHGPWAARCFGFAYALLLMR